MNESDQTLSALESLRLSAAQAYYSISRALRLDKVSALLQRAELSPDSPVWLLGHSYNPTTTSNQAEKSQIASQLARHFHSTPWMTYRTGFSPLHLTGDVSLRSDSGWGCTLRVSQMLVAQGLIRHVCGIDWRWPYDYKDDYKDDENEGEHHVDSSSSGGINIVESNTITNTVNDDDDDKMNTTIDTNNNNKQQQQHDVNNDNNDDDIINTMTTTITTSTSTAVLSNKQDPPDTLASVLRLFWDVPVQSSPFSLHNLCIYGAQCGVHPGRWLGPWTACCALESTAQHASPTIALSIRVLAGSGGGAPLLYTDTFIDAFHNNDSDDDGNNSDVDKKRKKGLILLIPLLLGLSGKLNTIYIPQLQSILKIPQSIGIIGGRPGSSLYFIGYQNNVMLYLDPHQVQPAACSDSDWMTFRCDVLRTMAIENIDPSMALGFYCSNIDEYGQLCDALQQIESMHSSAPLVCVRQGSMGDCMSSEPINEDWASESETTSSSSRSQHGDDGGDDTTTEKINSGDVVSVQREESCKEWDFV